MTFQESPPPQLRFEPSLDWVALATIGLERTDWFSEPKPPGEDIAFLQFPEALPMSFEVFPRGEVDSANNLALSLLSDQEVITVCTDGSFFGKKGWAFSSFGLFCPGIEPFMQTTFEGSGGNAYLAECLALFRALAAIIAHPVHSASSAQIWTSHLGSGVKRRIVIFCDNLSIITKL